MYFVPIKIGFILVVARTFVFCLFIFCYYHRYRASLKYTQNAACIISTKKQKKNNNKKHVCVLINQVCSLHSINEHIYIVFPPFNCFNSLVVRIFSIEFQFAHFYLCEISLFGDFQLKYLHLTASLNLFSGTSEEKPNTIKANDVNFRIRKYVISLKRIGYTCVIQLLS